tara:strand:- start:825 stop:1484 length:660 start_codon:yes stop_codon:yes gene_type:complete
MAKHRRNIVYDQPAGATDADVLGILPRRVAWTNFKADGKYRILLQMPYPDTKRGACYGIDDAPHLKDYPTNDEIGEAKQMCASCPILKQCGAWALAHESYYIYGGMTAEERKQHRERMLIQEFDPMHGFAYGLNEDWKKQAPTHCENGHGLDERDLVRVSQPVDDPYQHVYQVQCSQCWWERTYSPEAMEMRRLKGKKGAEALAKAGTRNTTDLNKWGQ